MSQKLFCMHAGLNLKISAKDLRKTLVILRCSWFQFQLDFLTDFMGSHSHFHHPWTLDICLSPFTRLETTLVLVKDSGIQAVRSPWGTDILSTWCVSMWLRLPAPGYWEVSQGLLLTQSAGLVQVLSLGFKLTLRLAGLNSFQCVLGSHSPDSDKANRHREQHVSNYKVSSSDKRQADHCCCSHKPKQPDQTVQLPIWDLRETTFIKDVVLLVWLKIIIYRWYPRC